MTGKKNSRQPPAATGENETEGFYARWSRRKAQADEQSITPVAEVEPAPDTRVAESGEPEKPPLPEVDTLNEDSDYSGFLSPEVDEKLRKLALRKLFHLPQFNIRDGLDDYDEDFRNFEPLGDIVTADMRFQQEREARLEAERLARQQETVPGELVATADDEGVEDGDEIELPPDDSPDLVGDVSPGPEEGANDDNSEPV